MLKQPNFFHTQPSTLPEEARAKFYLSTTFGLSFMITSIAPTRSSTSYAYLTPKLGTVTFGIEFKMNRTSLWCKAPAS